MCGSSEHVGMISTESMSLGHHTLFNDSSYQKQDLQQKEPKQVSFRKTLPIFGEGMFGNLDMPS